MGRRLLFSSVTSSLRYLGIALAFLLFALIRFCTLSRKGSTVPLQCVKRVFKIAPFVKINCYILIKIARINTTEYSAAHSFSANRDALKSSARQMGTVKIRKLKFDVYHGARQPRQLFSPDRFRCFW